jgi:hypothetical protein
MKWRCAPLLGACAVVGSMAAGVGTAFAADDPCAELSGQVAAGGEMDPRRVNLALFKPESARATHSQREFFSTPLRQRCATAPQPSSDLSVTLSPRFMLPDLAFSAI